MSEGHGHSGPEESRVPDLRNILIIFPTLATVAVGLRFITRTWVAKNLGIEDGCMLLALMFSWVAAALGIVSTCHGMGRHIYNLRQHQIMQSLKYTWIAELNSIAAFFFAKIAIALLLLRIIEVKQGYTYFLYSTMAVNLVASLIWLVLTFQCVPFNAVWDPALQSAAHCIPRIVVVNYGYAAGAIHSALDFTYVLLPIYLVWNIQLPLRRKLGLTLLLSVGIFTAASSIVKVSYTADLNNATDATYMFTDLTKWNIIEMNTGIAVGCIPPMRPLFAACYRKAARRFGWSTSERESGEIIGVGGDDWTGRRRVVGAVGWIHKEGGNTHPLEFTMLKEHEAGGDEKGFFQHRLRRDVGREGQEENGEWKEAEGGHSSIEEENSIDGAGIRGRGSVSRQSSREMAMAKDFAVVDRV